MHIPALRRPATALALMLPLSLSAAVSQAKADSIGHLLNAGDACASCAYYAGEHSAMGLWNTAFTLLLVVLGTVWLYLSKKKKFILVIGTVLGLAVVASYAYPEYLAPKTVPADCPVAVTDPSKADVFVKPGSEFIQANSSSDTLSTGTSDELVSVEGDDSGSTGETSDDKHRADEFQSSDQAASTDDFQSSDQAASTDDFQSSGDDFQSAGSPSTETAAGTSTPSKTWGDILRSPDVYEPVAIFLLIVLISLFIRNATFRKFRGLFLLASMVYLGFYRGACPCMISSFQNSVLLVMGVKVRWETLLFFLLLLPGAYFFGKIWCGWLCHLGALQEFLYKTFQLNFLRGRRAQHILKVINISVFVVWVLQLILTRTNLFCEYDPFKFAFNLMAPTTTGYVLLALLLVTSVLIYRPFCRSFCPVGLILGWVSLLPGARHLIKEESCIDCKGCDKACDQRALIHEDKKTTLSVPDCILCGECISECKVKKSLQIQCKK